MRNVIELNVVVADGSEERIDIVVRSARGAGFCSRDRDAVRRLSEERRRQGMCWTSKDYWTYRIGSYLVTSDDWIEVQGPMTGDEVEPVLVFSADGEFVGVGSDQCDREMSSLFLEKPKQMCPHPLGPTVWRLDDVRGHWDELQVESEVRVGETVVPHQRFSLSELVSLDTWLGQDALQNRPDATVFYAGTGKTVPGLAENLRRLGLPPECAHGVGDEFRMRLYDPVLGREIRHAYGVSVLGDDLQERRSQ